MAHRIETVAGRAKLDPRREPYWSRISAGQHLGYRKLSDGTGTWIARWRPPEGDRAYESLGAQPDYDTAVKAARAWFDHCENATPKKTTVTSACEEYVKDRRARKGDASAKDAEGRFKRYVYGKPIGRIELAKLKASHVSDWLNGLIVTDQGEEAERRSKDSHNRDLSALKAALNLAFRSGLVSSDASWRRVRSFEKVAKRRERFLTLKQRKALYAAAAADLKLLIRAVAVTAARPGELATARADAFDRKAATLTLDGKTGRRTVPLAEPAAAFFRTMTKDKLPAAPLLARADGTYWHRFAWRDAMQEAVKAAKLPKDVVLYSIRHAAISELLKAGIDPMSVARLAGTSVQMISRNYGHMDDAHVREQLAGVKVL